MGKSLVKHPLDHTFPVKNIKITKYHISVRPLYVKGMLFPHLTEI